MSPYAICVSNIHILPLLRRWDQPAWGLEACAFTQLKPSPGRIIWQLAFSSAFPTPGTASPFSLTLPKLAGSSLALPDLHCWPACTLGPCSPYSTQSRAQPQWSEVCRDITLKLLPFKLGVQSVNAFWNPKTDVTDGFIIWIVILKTPTKSPFPVAVIKIFWTEKPNIFFYLNGKT